MKFKKGDQVVFCDPEKDQRTYGVVRQIVRHDPEAYYIDLAPRYSQYSYFEGYELNYVHFADDQAYLQQYDLQDI